MERTDIPHSDVFFSWTGADRAMKDQLVAYLRKSGISCTESDHECAGDFQQWSREAVSKSTVFLLLYTENTPKSKYVPVEIEAFTELDDHYNRCIPVVTNFDLYTKNLPDLADHESAVILDENGLTEANLDEILNKVLRLIRNRLFAIYRQATAPTYLRFASLLREMRMTAEFEHEKLYINRSVTDESGKVISDAAEFCKTEDIIYLYGPAGSGKTCYIDQLRNAADENTLVLSLPCRTLLNTHNIFNEMYAEFCRHCGNRDFFSMAGFKSLLSAKHLLLILDGLDEIATQEGKEALFRATQDYYLPNALSTTLFITCRNSEDADLWKMNGQTPKVLQLHALEEDQIKDFGSNLFLLFGSPDKSDGFFIRIHDLAEEIRTNPLLLSQLAIIYNVKDEIPQTVVGIYDAICEIIVDKVKPSAAAPADFDKAIFPKLSAILKGFSAERYRLLSLGKAKSTEQIFKKILRDHGCNPDDASSLIQYLQDRAIMVGNEFYHKMLLEYFTAVHYYEQCFDDYDELENQDVLRDLFGHYNEPYWSTVLQLFLIKADSRSDAEATEGLYHALLALEITDFTLLFDTCKKLLSHKDAAQKALLTDILLRSATGEYPPYGPLFWYVPEYDLYGALLFALTTLQDKPCFTNALALTRDVCWIFGKYHTAEAANSRIDGKALLAKASLSGVRKGLCELFYQGSTNCADGNDIYPRCFNVAEAEKWKADGIGLYGRMATPFADELGLYSHEMLQPFGEEWVGIVSMGYDVEQIEEILPTRSCSKLCGLFLSPGKDTELQPLAINDKRIRIFYLPENAQFDLRSFSPPFTYTGSYIDGNGVMYVREKLTFPDGMTTMENCAFKCGSSVTSITISDGVTKIGNYAFADCSSLTSINIPESVTEIGHYAFNGCSSLTSITLPYGVTQIKSNAFAGCSSLTSINIPESVTWIDNAVFEGCSSLTSINIPEGVEKIGRDTFRDCSSLVSITIPKSVFRIEHGAFADCSSLTSITIPDGVMGIDAYTFRNCSSLVSITIPKSVIGIEPDAFAGCSSLTSITIPDGVAWIGEACFSGCSSLTSIRLPEQLHAIDQRVFVGCTALTHISNCPTFCDRANLGVSDDCVIDYREIKQIDIVFHSETEILPEEFKNREDITSIVLPKGVTKIGDRAFAACRSLSSITIPEGVTEIGREAFRDCCSLTSITIPEGVTRIAGGAFDGCSSLTSITIPEGITEIGREAFRNCCSLTSITIPEGVTKIGDWAFDGCSSLTSINIPERVTAIGNSAFDGCSSLTSINIPESVTEIESSAFHRCSSLTSIAIPEGVTKIGDWAFDGCSSLTSINIPERVTEIECSAFYHCTSLTSIAIPEGVTKIGRWAFEGCSSLTTITIPEGVPEIESQTFDGCSSLTSIVIPKSVRFIRDKAFSSCTSLREITLSRRFEDDLLRIFPDVDLSEVEISWH